MVGDASSRSPDDPELRGSGPPHPPGLPIRAEPELEAGATRPAPGRWRDRRRGHLTLALLALAALLGGGIGAGLSLRPSGTGLDRPGTAARRVVLPTVGSALAGPTRSVKAIVAAASPAVAQLHVVQVSPSREGTTTATGTGVVLTASGEVLTNHHVVERTTKVEVTVPGAGTHPATVVGVDTDDDLALLQLEGVRTPLATIRLGNAATVAVGDPIVAIGYAYGNPTATATTGSVVGLDETATGANNGPIASIETLDKLLEVRARIVSGDSGGPLLDRRGRLIGINTMASPAPAGAVTTAFAIPVNEAVTVVNRIVEGRSGEGVQLGARSYLGVFTLAQASAAGVVVADVAIDGPAAAAGIVRGDTITAVDGRPTPDATALEGAVARRRPGTRVEVAYLDRAGAGRAVTIRLGAVNP